MIKPCSNVYAMCYIICVRFSELLVCFACLQTGGEVLGRMGSAFQMAELSKLAEEIAGVHKELDGVHRWQELNTHIKVAGVVFVRPL